MHAIFAVYLFDIADSLNRLPLKGYRLMHIVWQHVQSLRYTIFGDNRSFFVSPRNDMIFSFLAVFTDKVKE